MPYASYSSLVKQHGEAEVINSADRDEDGVADADVVDQALADADGIINSRIAVAYKLPLQVVPPVLVAYAGDIALYKMSGATSTYTEEKRQRYDDAIRWLDQIAKGLAVLDGVPEPETKATGGIRMTAAAREYGVGKTRGIL